MANNPRWLYLLEKIAESWDDGDRSLRDNRTDKEVHRTILDTLVLGKPLSPKQSAALIRSIQRRVPFQSKFTWTGEIVLTRKQVRYADKNTLARIRQAFSVEPQGFSSTGNGPDLSPNSQPFVTQMSANSQPFVADSPSISPDFPLNELSHKDSGDPTQRYPHFAALYSDTKRHETRPSEYQQSDVPTGHDAPLSHHDTGTSTLTRVVHEAASPKGIGDSSGGIEKARHKIGEVALWLDQGLTGTINVNGIKAQLVFGTYYAFEHRFYQRHSNEGYRDWWHLYSELIADLVAIFESGKRDDSMGYQFAVSAIFKDRAGSELLDMRLAARLLYGANGEPDRMLLIYGREVYKVSISENKGTGTNAPLWRGGKWELLEAL
ncbi:hypothetical protein AS026_19430 [Rhizobium altiplani]|uniref:Uncharacterized protein n=1 Tax=Rhizobium altiplani TaxID=1864509 RepID=A0A109J7Q3_9HYPH|nr:hypothetical protein [Rhizobium altiplani]KWV43844.1 hypothetical protein AS026_19430 [Rhizobium altiplani]